MEIIKGEIYSYYDNLVKVININKIPDSEEIILTIQYVIDSYFNIGNENHPYNWTTGGMDWLNVYPNQLKSKEYAIKKMLVKIKKVQKEIKKITT